MQISITFTKNRDMKAIFELLLEKLKENSKLKYEQLLEGVDIVVDPAVLDKYVFDNDDVTDEQVMILNYAYTNGLKLPKVLRPIFLAPKVFLPSKITKVKTKPVLSVLNNFIGKDALRPQLAGVCCRKGLVLATDANVSILFNYGYDKEQENRVFKIENGNFGKRINSKFPLLEIAVPLDKDLDVAAELDVLTAFNECDAKLKFIKGYLGLNPKYVQTEFQDCTVRLSCLHKVLKSILEVGEHTTLVKYESGANRAFKFELECSVIVLMPYIGYLNKI